MPLERYVKEQNVNDIQKEQTTHPSRSLPEPKSNKSSKKETKKQKNYARVLNNIFNPLGSF
jgi:hypothetical protein